MLIQKGSKEHVVRLVHLFLRFALVSGVGWLLDLGSFALMVRWGGVPPYAANMVSSFVGITFVWLVTSRALFGVQQGARAAHLGGYWVYQLVSISVYSWLLHNIANFLIHAGQTHHFGGAASDWQVLAKLLITPCNLLTNFFFMKLLTRWSDRRSLPHV